MKVQEMIDEIRKNVEKVANVKALFGDLTKINNISIMPVASIHFKGGGGGGIGEAGESTTDNKKSKSSPDDKDSQKPKPNKAKGRGGGGGVQITADPVGYIEVNDDYTNFVHIVDKNRLALKAVKVFGIMLICMTVKSILKRKKKK